MDMNTQTASEYSKTPMVTHIYNAIFFIFFSILNIFYIKEAIIIKNVCKIKKKLILKIIIPTKIKFVLLVLSSLLFRACLFKIIQGCFNLL